ncbi:MAG: hypothetical protein IPN15_15925 [Saprospiraceae bacterium]|nr:hypothetical protein [Candidatus Vicinibacter affinis]
MEFHREAYIPYETSCKTTRLWRSQRNCKLTSGSLLVLSNDPIPNPGKAIKVYFRKDDPNYFDKNVPNWFYYWLKAAKSQSLDISPGTKLAVINQFPDPVGYVMNSNPTPLQIPISFSKENEFKFKSVNRVVPVLILLLMLKRIYQSNIIRW